MARAKSVAKKVEKKAAVKTVNAAKAAASIKAEETPEVVETAKASETADEIVKEKAAVKPAETDKAAAAEKPAKAAEEKAAKAAKPAKAAAEKTTRAAKAAKASSEKIVLQVNGRADLSMDSLVEKVKAAYAAEGHSVDSIKDIEVYIKLDENMAYYVIDGYASGTSLY